MYTAFVSFKSTNCFWLLSVLFSPFILFLFCIFLGVSLQGAKLLKFICELGGGGPDPISISRLIASDGSGSVWAWVWVRLN